MNIGRQIGRNMLPSDSLIVGLYADILIMSKACFGIIKTKQFNRCIAKRIKTDIQGIANSQLRSSFTISIQNRSPFFTLDPSELSDKNSSQYFTIEFF